MEPWLEAESRIRRNEIMAAKRIGRARREATRRTLRIRRRIADGAQALSDAIAILARTLRNGEAG